MRLAPALLAAALVATTHLPVAARSACADPTVRLNEIMAGPSHDWNGDGVYSSRDDEWVEIANTGPSSVTLDGFVLMDGDSIPRYAFSGTLAAGTVQVVFGKDSYDWEKATGHPAFGLSLGNSGDRVTLWQVTGVDTMFVDGYTFASHLAAADRSVGRSVTTGAWTLFDAQDPYSGSAVPGGNGCQPTPGTPNDCNTTPARSSTWGEIKTRYR
jgi:Lamin Tail Domain